jgi:hypothetical protein
MAGANNAQRYPKGDAAGTRDHQKGGLRERMTRARLDHRNRPPG